MCEKIRHFHFGKGLEAGVLMIHIVRCILCCFYEWSGKLSVQQSQKFWRLHKVVEGH